MSQNNRAPNVQTPACNRRTPKTRNKIRPFRTQRLNRTVKLPPIDQSQWYLNSTSGQYSSAAKRRQLRIKRYVLNVLATLLSQAAKGSPYRDIGVFLGPPPPHTVKLIHLKRLGRSKWFNRSTVGRRPTLFRWRLHPYIHPIGEVDLGDFKIAQIYSKNPVLLRDLILTLLSSVMYLALLIFYF